MTSVKTKDAPVLHKRFLRGFQRVSALGVRQPLVPKATKPSSSYKTSKLHVLELAGQCSIRWKTGYFMGLGFKV